MNLRASKKTENAEVFTAALNDIMFFLMLFFLMISTLLNPNVIKLNLPNAKNPQSIHKREISISVTKDKQYFVDNIPVSFSELDGVLTEKVGKDPDCYIVLRFDNELSIQNLVDVLDIGNRNHIKMIMATQPN